MFHKLSQHRTAYHNEMLLVQVNVHVKEEFIDAFREASIVNGKASREEPGIARFDLLQQKDSPQRFVLLEAYRTAEAASAHKETAHYAIWRDTVAPMMAEPRTSIKFETIDPPDEVW